MTDEEWVVVAQHIQQMAFNPIDAQGVELLALQEALGEQGIEACFLPYRPGEGGGFTDALDQPFQLLVKRSDSQRAREVALEILGTDSGLVV